MAESSEQRGGLGCLSVLLIIFVVLKLTGNIGWSWWLVLAPLWISFGFIAIVLVFALTIAVLRR